MHARVALDGRAKLADLKCVRRVLASAPALAAAACFSALHDVAVLSRVLIHSFGAPTHLKGLLHLAAPEHAQVAAGTRARAVALGRRDLGELGRTLVRGEGL